jgi:hypothetical protein
VSPTGSGVVVGNGSNGEVGYQQNPVTGAWSVVQTPDGPALDANGNVTAAGLAAGLFPPGTKVGQNSATGGVGLNGPTGGGIGFSGEPTITYTPGKPAVATAAANSATPGAPTPTSAGTGAPAAASTGDPFTGTPAALTPGGVDGGFGIYSAGPTVPVPDQLAFEQQIANAGGLAKAYGQDAGAALGRAAPQIAGLTNYDRSMGALGAQYGALAQNDPLAQGEYAQALGQDINSQTSMARSATGGAIGQAGAERAALANSAGLAAGQAGNAGLLQGQLQGQFLTDQGQAYSQREAANAQQAGLNEQQVGQNYGLAQSLYGLQNNSSQGELAGLSAYTNAQNQSAQSQIASNQLEAAVSGQLLNTAIGAGAGIAGIAGQGFNGSGSYTSPATTDTGVPTDAGTTAPAPTTGALAGAPTPDPGGGLALSAPQSLTGSGIQLNGTGAFNSDENVNSDENAKIPIGDLGSNGLPPLLSPDQQTPAQQVQAQANQGLAANYAPKPVQGPQPQNDPGLSTLASVLGGVSGLAGPGGSLFGAALGAGNAGFNSDENAKHEEGDAPKLADVFLHSLDPKSYAYRSPKDEPVPNPHGGEYLGVMAQDLERVPDIGPQLVSQQPGQYKRVNTGAAISALLAGMGRLNQKYEELRRG